MLHRQLLVFKIFMVDICPKSGRYLLPLVLFILVIVLIVLIRGQVFYLRQPGFCPITRTVFQPWRKTRFYPSGVAKSLSIRQFHIDMIGLGELLPSALNQPRRL